MKRLRGFCRLWGFELVVTTVAIALSAGAAWMIQDQNKPRPATVMCMGWSRGAEVSDASMNAFGVITATLDGLQVKYSGSCGVMYKE